MTPPQDVTALTRSMVSIPSYVDGHCDEGRLAEYLETQLSELGFPEIERWPISGSNRYNVVAFSRNAKDRCKVILAGHMDTVSEKNGWKVDPYQGIIREDKLYGLGAADMKGGIAAILTALRQSPLPEGICVLFYCDEEYEFSGMQSFLTAWSGKAPDTCLIAEPTDLNIMSECRGVIEILVRVAGKTGHSSRPDEGNNAIIGLTEVLLSLKSWLGSLDEVPFMGHPTFNIARMKGGALLSDADVTSAESIVGFANGSNNIADYAEALIEVRPTRPAINAEAVQQILSDGLHMRRLQVLQSTSALDVSVLRTPRQSLSWLEGIVARHTGTASFQDARRHGYTDGQLLQQHFLEHDNVRVPVACLGPEGGDWHGPNEWVSIRSLYTLAAMYSDIIESVRINH